MKIMVYDENGHLFLQKDVPDGVGVLTVGRHSDCDILLPGNRVSRHHAKIHFIHSAICIEDTKSSIGVLVNGEKIESESPANIELNDKVQIGPFVLKFVESSSSAAPLPSSPKKAEIKSKGGDVSEQFRQEFGNFSELYEENVMKLIRNIHEDVLEKLNLSKDAIKLVNNSDMQLKVEQSLDLALNERRHEIPVTLSRDLLRQTLLDELVGFGPLSRLLRSHKISEIMINGPSNIFVEYQGVCYPTEARFFNEQHLISIIQRIVEPLGRHIDEASPMVDARLPDGSRVNAIIPPLALRGASVTIRKFADKKLTTDDLIKFGSMTQEMALFLETAVKNRKNILVSGGTGSGKTTLLNVLSLFIPQKERVITVEDSAELKLTHPNLVSLEARPANIEGKGRITIRDLVINTLRMRPDRIIVGECRGPEALDMLQAMNTGHDGSLTTAHANSPRDALTRLENMVMMAGFELPSAAIREQIASALDLIVQQTRMSDGSRKIIKITEITGREKDQITMQDIFVFEQTGFDENQKVTGCHTATGNIPQFVEDLRRCGKLELDMSVFVPKN